MKVKAVGYRVLIKQEQVAQATESGIVLSSGKEHARKQAGQIWGTIVDIGEVAFTGADWGKGDRELFKKGTRVIFTRYAGQTFKEDDKNDYSATYHLAGDACVLGILDDEQSISEVA